MRGTPRWDSAGTGSWERGTRRAVSAPDYVWGAVRRSAGERRLRGPWLTGVRLDPPDQARWFWRPSYYCDVASGNVRFRPEADITSLRDHARHSLRWRDPVAGQAQTRVAFPAPSLAPCIEEHQRADHHQRRVHVQPERVLSSTGIRSLLLRLPGPPNNAYTTCPLWVADSADRCNTLETARAVGVLQDVPTTG